MLFNDPSLEYFEMTAAEIKREKHILAEWLLDFTPESDLPRGRVATMPSNRRPASRQDRGPTVTTSPTPGLYKTRLVKGGPMLPVRIFWSVARDPETGVKMDRPAQLLCLVAGEHVDPHRYWPMRPVDEAEYARLLDAMPDDVRATDFRKARTF